MCPFVVLLESLQGSRSKADANSLIAMFQALNVVYATERDCKLSIEIVHALAPSHGVGALDGLIGAMAIGNEATLCTFNDKHYRAIPRLKLLRPYAKS